MIKTTRRTRSTRKLALLLVALTGVSACGGDGGTGPNYNPEGTYVLSDVDDFAPPATIYSGPWVDPVHGTYYGSYVVQVTNAAIELDDTGRYALLVVGQVSADGIQNPAHLASGGTYELDDRDIWLQPDQGAPVTASGTLRNGMLTIDLDLISRGATNHYTFRR